MRIYSYAQFKESLGAPPRCGNYLYRGIGGQFRLIPSVAYSGEKDPNILLQRSLDAQQRFNNGLRTIYSSLNLTDYQLTFLARHCGLVSPYMDFSFDDTVAIQFGIEMANDNAVHLYVLNVENEPIYGDETALLDSKGFQIYRPNIIWHPDGFLTREKTQLIQSARLVTQNTETIAIPFDETYQERVKRYEIFPEDFENITKEIGEEGITMGLNLLVNSTDMLCQLASEINERAKS